MRNKKAAISVNTIVYVAIAVFVLILIIGFTTGAFQDLWAQITGQQTELDTIKEDCKTLCAEAKNDVDSGGTSAWLSSDYCGDTYSYDIDSSGEVDGDEANLHCWNPGIDVACSTTVIPAAGATKQCAMDAGDDVRSCSSCKKIVAEPEGEADGETGT